MKYKIWDVIKMLCENPKLQFKNMRTGTIVKIEIPLGSESGELVTSVGDNWVTTFTINNPDRGNSGDEWELIQQPVPFLEAVKAYSECKTIRCEIDGDKRIYDSKYGFMTSTTGTPIKVKEILYGTWFIELGKEE